MNSPYRLLLIVAGFALAVAFRVTMSADTAPSVARECRNPSKRRVPVQRYAHAGRWIRRGIRRAATTRSGFANPYPVRVAVATVRRQTQHHFDARQTSGRRRAEIGCRAVRDRSRSAAGRRGRTEARAVRGSPPSRDRHGQALGKTRKPRG